MRYFLVSYISAEGFGSIWFEHKQFPSYQWLCLKITEGRSREDVIILNIFEFKSKEDFDNFRK
ncbi:MAG: hypothetical protein OHK0045_04840 [Raineya sp.]